MTPSLRAESAAAGLFIETTSHCFDNYFGKVLQEMLHTSFDQAVGFGANNVGRGITHAA
jgi:hypothetical protein